MTRNDDSSNSRISPYTKPYLEATDDDVPPANPSSYSSGSKERQHQSESVNDNKTTPNTAGIQSLAGAQQDVSVDSPYVQLPAAGCNLPISQYSCIEQATSDSAAASAPGLQAGVDLCPQDAVIEGGEGTKCDGYVPWSSTQPSL